MLQGDIETTLKLFCAWILSVFFGIITQEISLSKDS